MHFALGYTEETGEPPIKVIRVSRRCTMLLDWSLLAMVQHAAVATVIEQTLEPFVRFDGIGGLSGVRVSFVRCLLSS